MKVIYGINKIVKFRRPVVALGVFDGVHRGHVHILKGAVSIARRIKGTAVVLTFDPHPQKENSLSSLEHRLRLMRGLGIETCVVINFNRPFSQMSAEDFVKNILVKKINPAYVCVGKDFRFGKAALGNIELLDKLSREYNFKLKAFSVIRQNNQRISSSNIRKFILKGKFKNAAKLLGRPVSVLGTVVKGDSLAEKLGFPTANVNPHHEILPAGGIYAVKVILGKHILKGVCSIGTRPTFFSAQENKIEVHIFNFQKNIYGKYLEIQFIKKIRNQKKFLSAKLLIEAINKDILKVRKIFAAIQD